MQPLAVPYFLLQGILQGYGNSEVVHAPLHVAGCWLAQHMLSLASACHSLKVCWLPGSRIIFGGHRYT